MFLVHDSLDTPPKTTSSFPGLCWANNTCRSPHWKIFFTRVNRPEGHSLILQCILTRFLFFDLCAILWCKHCIGTRCRSLNLRLFAYLSIVGWRQQQLLFTIIRSILAPSLALLSFWDCFSRRTTLWPSSTCHGPTSSMDVHPNTEDEDQTL